MKKSILALAAVTATVLGFVEWTTLPAQADAPQEILQVTSDNSKSRGLIYRFELQTDGGRIEKLVYHTFEEKTSKPLIEEYTLAQVNAPTGINIVVRDGREVVKLFGENVTAIRGGRLRLDYLVNGAPGFKHRKDFFVNVVRKPNGDWAVTQNGVEIKHLFFKTNKLRLLGGKEVGVKAIEVKS